jgi:hypothetical protein
VNPFSSGGFKTRNSKSLNVWGMCLYSGVVE